MDIVCKRGPCPSDATWLSLPKYFFRASAAGEVEGWGKSLARSLTEQLKSIPVPTTAMFSFEDVVSAKERASSGVKWQGAECAPLGMETR